MRRDLYGWLKNWCYEIIHENSEWESRVTYENKIALINDLYFRNKIKRCVYRFMRSQLDNAFYLSK